MGALDIGQGPTISELTAKVVLNKKFISDVSTPLVVDLIQENSVSEPTDPTITGEYIVFAVNVIPVGLKNARGVYEKTGIATAQIFTPIGSGYGRYTEISQTITNTFQDAQWGQRVMIVTDVSPQPGFKSGSYWQVNVLISFTFQDNGTD
ncbi:MAG TPA: hypothetical protein EYN51_01205 [Flavobacteriales bacterium]|nr:hypothetical protein [Flavobacteriales bacterium]